MYHRAVRRALVVVGSGLGLSAVWGGLWRRRRKAELAEETGPDPAEELRARLAESRASADAVEAEPPAAGEPIASAPEPSPLDPEARRRSIHERTRASIDQLGSG